MTRRFARAVTSYAGLAGLGALIVLAVELLGPRYLSEPSLSAIYAAAVFGVVSAIGAGLVYYWRARRAPLLMILLTVFIIGGYIWNARWHKSHHSDQLVFPRMLDEYTRMDSIATEGSETIILITLLAVPEDIYVLGRYTASLRFAATTRYCSMDELEPVFAAGGGVTMRYLSRQGIEIAGFRIGAEECRQDDMRDRDNDKGPEQNSPAPGLGMPASSAYSPA